MAVFVVELKDAVSGAAKMAGQSVGQLRVQIDQLDSSAKTGGAGADKLGGALGSMGAEGKAAAAGLAAATAALALLVAGMAMAISVTEQRDKITATFQALGKGATAGKDTLAMLDKLSATLPFTTEQLGEMAKGLAAAGFSGKALEEGIKAIAAATALMGEKGGAAAEKVLKALNGGGAAADKMLKSIQKGSGAGMKALQAMGITMEDLGGKAAVAKMSAAELQKAIEKALQKKGAGPLEAMGGTLAVLAAKGKEALGAIFEGLGPAVQPFMHALQDVLKMFSRGSTAGNALKGAVTKVFTVIFGLATRVVKAFKEIVQGIEGTGNKSSVFNKIGQGLLVVWGIAQKVWAAIKSGASIVWGGIMQVVTAVQKFAAQHQLVAKLQAAFSFVAGELKKVFSNAQVMNGIKTILKGIGIAIGVVIAVVVGLAVVFATVAAAVWATIAFLIGGFGALVDGIIDAVTSIASTLSDWVSSAASAASSFVDGLVNGIQAGAGQLIAMVTNLAKSALGAFKAALGIASPSKVMAVQGGHMAAGAAMGVDAGAPKVAAASKRMGSAATKGAAEGGVAGGKGAKGGDKGGKGLQITFENGAIQITGAGSAMELTEEAIAVVFEKIAIKEGLVT